MVRLTAVYQTERLYRWCVVGARCLLNIGKLTHNIGSDRYLHGRAIADRRFTIIISPSPPLFSYIRAIRTSVNTSYTVSMVLVFSSSLLLFIHRLFIIILVLVELYMTRYVQSSFFFVYE